MKKRPMRPTVYGVLIADVVQSTLRPKMRIFLSEKLAVRSRQHLREKLISLPYAVTAGDEFQTITSRLASIPEIILDLRIALQSLSLRIGVGIGSVDDRIAAPVNRVNGEAFQRARKAIDSVKAGSLFKFETLTAFDSADTDFNQIINMIYGLQDTLVFGITRKQWQAIQVFRHNQTLEKTARQLKLDDSTISRNLKRGYYWQLAETVKVAEAAISVAFT